MKRLQDLIVDALPGSVMDWTPPLPLGPFYGPPFALHALSPDHGAFVQSVATSTQTPPDLAAWASLAAVGAATRGRYVVTPKADWKEPVHIQALQVIASGSGKSPVYRHIIAPIEDTETRWHEEWRGEHDLWELQQRRLETAERKARKEADKLTAGDDSALGLEAVEQALIEHARNEPVLKRIIVDDTTAEALWSVIDRQAGSVAVMSAEGGFLANITGRYSDAPIFDPVLKGYSGEPHTLDRKTDRESRRILRTNLAISIAIQPVVLKNMGAVPGFDRMGMSGRFLYTIPAPVVWPDLDAPAPPEHLTEWWADAITRIATDTAGSAYSPRALTLSSDASRAFQAERAWWRESRARGLFADMTEWGQKYPGMTLRIAGLLHIVETPIPSSEAVSGDTLRRAVTIMRDAIEHARLAHGLMYGAGGHELASDVLEELKRLGEAVPRTVLNQSLRHRTAFQKAAHLEPPLQLLEEYGWIKRVRQEAEQRGKHPGGRPSETIHLNPLSTRKTTLTTLETTPHDRSGEVVGVVSGYSGETQKSNLTQIPRTPNRDALDPTGTDGLPEWEM